MQDSSQVRKVKVDGALNKADQFTKILGLPGYRACVDELTPARTENQDDHSETE